jgi:glycosyltransferase involved in cell wall biosynthesis
MKRGARQWVVCQLGAREHYVLPRELHRRNLLQAMLTDAWIAPSSRNSRVAGSLNSRLNGRFAADLDSAAVHHFTASLLAFELKQRIVGTQGWDRIIARNDWFQRKVVQRCHEKRLFENKPVVFAYSYAAANILEAAREAGCKTVLGQIDPGIFEDQLVSDLARQHGLDLEQYERPPALYWEKWRQECALADCIVVNSEWSREGVVSAGIDPSKVRVVPLAYDGGRPRELSDEHRRKHPSRFSADRPLRVLFLGQAGVRKGAIELLEAMNQLASDPIHLTIVGPVEGALQDRVTPSQNVTWVGPVARNAVDQYFDDADLFILPTHSDGFALTQLEAAAHQLPLLVSQYCGKVVQDGVNGRVFEAVSADAIADLLRRSLDPSGLADMSKYAPEVLPHFAPGVVVDRLLDEVASI